MSNINNLQPGSFQLSSKNTSILPRKHTNRVANKETKSVECDKARADLYRGLYLCTDQSSYEIKCFFTSRDADQSSMGRQSWLVLAFFHHYHV